MIITRYNAICNLGTDIGKVFSKALNGVADCFEIRGGKRLACVKTTLPAIKNPDYNLRCNQLLLKALEPLNVEGLDKNSTAVVVATTNSGVEEYEQSKNIKHSQIGNPAEFLKTHFGFNKFYTSVSTACSSGVKAFIIAKELLDSGVAKTVIVAGVDPIAKVPIYGFSALEILSKEPTNPFSKNRCGINIGEGAAAFVLQKEGVGIEVAGLGETTDFYHPTTPDPEGIEAEKAIRLALGDIKPGEVDYINLHGTGTGANDLMEARAIYNVFKDNVYASSTKPLTGHCLGAAASVEAALCCALIDSNQNKLLPHIYDGEFDENLAKIKLADKNTVVKEIKTCLSTSFGFGGTNCAMILRRQR